MCSAADDPTFYDRPSLVCADCGGDVERFFVGDTVRFRHAVKGIDHGPMPIEAPRQGGEPRLLHDVSAPADLSPADRRLPPASRLGANVGRPA